MLTDFEPSELLAIISIPRLFLKVIEALSGISLDVKFIQHEHAGPAENGI